MSTKKKSNLRVNIRIKKVVKIHSKHVLGTRNGAHFMVRCLDLTMMVIKIAKLYYENSLNKL